MIYYANETAPDAAESANYAKILGWLDAAKTPATSLVAGRIRKDLEEFKIATDVEIDSLERSVVAGKLAPNTGVVIFTNRLARRNVCLVRRPGQSRFTEERFVTLSSPNYILSSSRLSQIESFRRALERAVQLFSPSSADFTLIVSSHGSTELALTPRLCVRNEETTPNELITVVNDELMPSSSTATHPAPLWIQHRIGTKKPEFYAAIKDAARSGMVFPLIFINSCYGDLGGLQAEKAALGNGSMVGTIVTSKGSMPYLFLDYYHVFAGSSGTVGEALSSALYLQWYLALPNEVWSFVKARSLFYLPLAATLLVALIWTVFPSSLASIRRKSLHKPQ